MFNHSTVTDGHGLLALSHNWRDQRKEAESTDWGTRVEIIRSRDTSAILNERSAVLWYAIATISWLWNIIWVAYWYLENLFIAAQSFKILSLSTFHCSQWQTPFKFLFIAINTEIDEIGHDGSLLNCWYLNSESQFTNPLFDLWRFCSETLWPENDAYSVWHHNQRVVLCKTDLHWFGCQLNFELDLFWLYFLIFILKNYRTVLDLTKQLIFSSHSCLPLKCSVQVSFSQ